MLGEQDQIVATTSTGRYLNRVTVLTPEGYFGAWGDYGPLDVTSVLAGAGGSFVTSMSDGTMSGDDPDYDLMHLTKAQSFGYRTWLGGASPTLAAMAGPNFSPADSAWPTEFGSGANAVRSYWREEDAVFAALDYIYPIAVDTKVEWGGLICKRGDRYRWPPAVTSYLPDEVHVLELAQCAPDEMATGDYHTHQGIFDSIPSGYYPGTKTPNDIDTADHNEQLVFYLKAPNFRGAGLYFLKYQKTPAVSSSRCNIFEFVPPRTWRLFPWYEPACGKWPPGRQ